MALTLRYAVRSDRGLVRGNNEDSVYAGPRLLAIADGMGEDARREVAGPPEKGVVEHAAKDSSQPLLVLDAEEKGRHGERERREGALGDRLEVFLHEPSCQEAAPEQLLHERHHEDGTEQSEGEEGQAGERLRDSGGIEDRDDVTGTGTFTDLVQYSLHRHGAPLLASLRILEWRVSIKIECRTRRTLCP